MLQNLIVGPSAEINSASYKACYTASHFLTLYSLDWSDVKSQLTISLEVENLDRYDELLRAVNSTIKTFVDIRVHDVETRALSEHEDFVSESPNLTAFQVVEYDVDGKNIEHASYFLLEASARHCAFDLLRKNAGVLGVKLFEHRWVGANFGDTSEPLVEVTELPIIKMDDPEVLEYLRLREKFKNIRIPGELND